MTGRLLNLLTVLSLLLCVAAVALWVRSHSVADSCGSASLKDRRRGPRAEQYGRKSTPHCRFAFRGSSAGSM
jgi:hypothetical protein